jgi:hypothetical protein
MKNLLPVLSSEVSIVFHEYYDLSCSIQQEKLRKTRLRIQELFIDYKICDLIW